uniref:Photosystem II protein K n=1 Tax=Guibourtia tessmannii TaxID=327904 RepID=A0A8F3FK50_9FABA|nr:photosystem II protein K [Guibourtia tessmannii]
MLNIFSLVCIKCYEAFHMCRCRSKWKFLIIP